MRKNKLYSEPEVRKIISMEMNWENSSDSGNDRSEITHEELLQIGREAGIDESNISTERWIAGRMSQIQIANLFTELKLRLELQSGWWGNSDELKRLGDSYELSFHDSRVTLHEKKLAIWFRFIKPNFLMTPHLNQPFSGFRWRLFWE